MTQTRHYAYKDGEYQREIIATDAELTALGYTSGPMYATVATEAMIRSEGARRLREIVSMYTDEERETWATQVKEVEAFTANPLAVVPFISGLAIKAGITTAAMVAIIKVNVDAYTLAASTILGSQRALIALLAADNLPSDWDTNETHWT